MAAPSGNTCPRVPGFNVNATGGRANDPSTVGRKYNISTLWDHCRNVAGRGPWRWMRGEMQPVQGLPGAMRAPSLWVVLHVMQLSPGERMMVAVLKSHIPVHDPGTDEDNVRLDGA